MYSKIDNDLGINECYKRLDEIAENFPTTCSFPTACSNQYDTTYTIVDDVWRIEYNINGSNIIVSGYGMASFHAAMERILKSI